jgi:hypothetical protein
MLSGGIWMVSLSTRNKQTGHDMERNFCWYYVAFKTWTLQNRSSVIFSLASFINLFLPSCQFAAVSARFLLFPVVAQTRRCRSRRIYLACSSWMPSCLLACCCVRQETEWRITIFLHGTYNVYVTLLLTLHAILLPPGLSASHWFSSSHIFTYCLNRQTKVPPRRVLFHSEKVFTVCGPCCSYILGHYVVCRFQR